MPPTDMNMNKLSIVINQSFEEMVESKAKELISIGEKTGQINLDSNRKGTLKIFIGEKPELVMFSFELDGHKVYVGDSANK